MPESSLLNSEQILAIKHEAGPLLIIAGAGTGKTTVITERIRHLIVEKKVDSSSILALTFTEKAAYEMQERIDILLPYGYTNLWIHTFHSFCDRILRDEAHNIGLDASYKLISEGEAVLLMKKNVFDMGLSIFKPRGNPAKFLEDLLKHFSRLKDEDISPKEYIKWAKNYKGESSKEYLELSFAYEKYEQLKIKNSLMDFSDLISNTLLLLRERKAILKKLQKQFRFIMVDEFQDTNYAQNELAMLLAGDDRNITVVADDDQSIYRFRGAAVSNVLQFKKNFPKTKIITLLENYRSTPKILDASYSLIQNNNPNRLEVVEKIDKKLKSQSKSAGDDIELIYKNRAEDEAEEIAKTIKGLEKNFNYKDIAILARANNHLQGITGALQRNRIPYQFLGPGYLFSQDEVKDLIAYLTLLTNLSDSVSLFRVLSMDIFDISPVELNFLLNFAKKKNLTLFESLNDLDKPFLKPRTQEVLKNVKEMIENHLRKSRKEKAGQILYYFLIDSGLYKKLLQTNSLAEERRVQNIAKFFDRVKNFETERDDANIFTLTEWLTLLIQMGDSPTAADVDASERNAVNMLTVHSSKGLEFPVVFMVNLVSDRFPSRERSEKIPLSQGIIKEDIPKNIDYHMEEERRLFYVGMTRAQKRLYFSASSFYGSGKRPRKLSPFIFEALPHLFEKQKKDEGTLQLSLTDILSSYEDKSDSEEERKPVKVDYITFSNLQMFDICPMHYKAKVILNIPTPQASVQSFGVSIHATLYKLYRFAKEGKTLDLSEVKALLKNEWISEGYDGKRHEAERFSQANKLIEEFYNTQFNPKSLPLGLELPFSFILKNGVKVFGKIDRVDKKDKGIEIIDYKTGEDNPKAKTAHELQLAIYALAATKVKDSVLDKTPDKISLTIHFLEGNTKKSMKFSDTDLEKLEDELIEKIKEIEKSDFKCSGNMICKTCEYRMLCSAI